MGNRIIASAFLFLAVASLSIPQANSVFDLDNDGIADNDDLCPNLREDFEGAVDGCPSKHKIVHDSDGDLIQDDVDSCPTLPETFNGIEDGDGCPEKILREPRETADSDDDGFSDLLDSCPNQPENFNGILDDDGCPEQYIPLHDYDLDWIPNSVDQCITERETYNRFDDYDGCPDKAPYGFDVTQFPDADEDRIDDRWDKCVGEPENYNGYLDWDGCTDDISELSDSDGDGVPDMQDVCPNHEETINKFHDYDGCPDVGLEGFVPIQDDDKDGIPNGIDLCQSQPETWNKFKDSDGCPDSFADQSRMIHDNDLDGIIDDLDECPYADETYNGILDSDGCPDGNGQVLIKPAKKATPQPANLKIFSESLQNDPIRGNPKAPIIVVQFADFSCSFCSLFLEQIMPSLEKEYLDTGKIKLVFRDFPKDDIRDNSMQAHIAAQCANEQGKFWKYHDLLYANQNLWNTVSPIDANLVFEEFASKLRLNLDDFATCYTSNETAEEVYLDYLDGRKYGANLVPTFFIGNEKFGYDKIEGEIPFVQFKNTIESQLKCAIYSC